MSHEQLHQLIAVPSKICEMQADTIVRRYTSIIKVASQLATLLIRPMSSRRQYTTLRPTQGFMEICPGRTCAEAFL